MSDLTFSSVVVFGLTAFVAPDMPAPTMPIRMQFLPAQELVHRCGFMRLGCTFVTKDRCDVWIIADVLDPRQRLEVTRHELAHCSGWRH